MNTVLLRRLISWDTLKYWADTKNLRQHEDKVLLMLTLLSGRQWAWWLSLSSC